MINVNKLMKIELNKQKIISIDNELRINSITNEIINNTKIIKDCIVYDKLGELQEENIDFEKIMRFYGDKTGYEVSCNELRFEKQEILPNHFVELAGKLNCLLSKKYYRKMVIYISVYEDDIDLRFHTYREDEGFWLDLDLNKYDVPVLSCI